MNLEQQLFDCLPAGRYALSGLLRLVDIVETDAVPTAAVECHAQPRMFINPAFVAEHAATPEKLMMLVLHEVHHVLLGHTRRLATATPVDNLVFDCVINALLCRMFPQPEYTALFRDFYADDQFPVCLLRPPEGWNPQVRTVPVPPGLEGKRMGPARQVYRSLYSAEGASYDDIRHVLRVFLESNLRMLVGVRLLGDHDGSAKGEATASGGLFAQAVADIVRHWPAPPQPLRGMSMDDLLRDGRVSVRRAPTRRELLRSLIRKVAGATNPGAGARRMVLQHTVIETPLPCHDRRALVSRSLGGTPLLYRSSIPILQAMPSQERVHIYVDVSGSMEGIKGALYGAVLDCQALVFPHVHLFSTQVAEVSPAQLRAGICRSTGGTDIRCVTSHMVRRKVRRAVLLTDGFVGDPDADGAAVLAKARLGVAYAGVYTTQQHLQRHAHASVMIDLHVREQS